VDITLILVMMMHKGDFGSSGLYTLLGRGFFVFFPLTRRKKETFARLCSPFVSIHPKVWTGNYQDHLANDGISSRVLNRKTRDLAEVFFPSRLIGKYIVQKNLFQAGYGFQDDVDDNILGR